MLLEYRITIALCVLTEFSLMLIPIGVFFFFFLLHLRGIIDLVP